MQRRITGFHQDLDQHWVAELECGHTQHVRHQPPLQTRPWVLTEATRNDHLGTLLDCLLCDGPANAAPHPAPGNRPEVRVEYLDARMRGLCHDGALEVARHPPGDSPAESD